MVKCTSKRNITKIDRIISSLQDKNLDVNILI